MEAHPVAKPGGGRRRAPYAEGREVDPGDPSTFVPTVDEMAARVFDEQDREAARSDFKAKLASGELHLLRVPASEMAARPEPTDDERAEVEATRARYRTQHAGLAAKIRRALRGKVTS